MTLALGFTVLRKTNRQFLVFSYILDMIGKILAEFLRGVDKAKEVRPPRRAGTAEFEP
jgi:hypothetical protein